MSQALQGQLGIAEKSGLDIQNKMKTNVLGTARGQAADAQSGMAQASRLETSTALNRARANQEVAQSKLNAAVKIGSKFVGQGLKNKSETGKFFTPGNAELDADMNTVYKPAENFQDRLRSGLGSI
jgi:hypothetical protein